jgi:hypothetical protein
MTGLDSGNGDGRLVDVITERAVHFGRGDRHGGWVFAAHCDDGRVIDQADSGTRECPVCGTAFPASSGPGRPRVYCSDRCRKRAGHQVEAEQARRRRAERGEWSLDDLMAWAATQPEFPDPW